MKEDFLSQQLKYFPARHWASLSVNGHLLWSLKALSTGPLAPQVPQSHPILGSSLAPPLRKKNKNTFIARVLVHALGVWVTPYIPNSSPRCVLKDSPLDPASSS